MKKNHKWLAVIVLSLGAVSFAKWPNGTDPLATSELQPKSGSNVTGTVDIGRSRDGILVRVYLTNMKPGSHGIHVHEKGDCSAADASSAGEHFNPAGVKHGSPTSSSRHLGDFGNVKVSKSGDVRQELKISNPGTAFDWESLIGKSIVLHRGADDLVSQPAGNSGDRIACGVLQDARKLSE